MFTTDTTSGHTHLRLSKELVELRLEGGESTAYDLLYLDWEVLGQNAGRPPNDASERKKEWRITCTHNMGETLLYFYNITHTPVHNRGQLCQPLSAQPSLLVSGTGVPPSEDGGLKPPLELCRRPQDPGVDKMEEAKVLEEVILTGCARQENSPGRL